MAVSGNTSGVRITAAGGESVAPGGGIRRFVVGADTGSVAVLVETTNAITGAGDLEVIAHPISPEGTYYPFGPTGVEIGVASNVAAGLQAVLLKIDGPPSNIFGITVTNNDIITHDLGVVVYGNGDQ